MSESFLPRSLKILGRARPYPKFGDFFFRPQCGKEIPWAWHCFWKKSGCCWARKYPQNFSVVVKGEFWDIFDHTQKWSGHFLGVVKNVPESPCDNYYV